MKLALVEGPARPGEHSRAAGSKPRAEPQPGPAGQSEHRAEVRLGDTWPGHTLHQCRGRSGSWGHRVPPARPPPCGSEAGDTRLARHAPPPPCGGGAGLWGDIQSPDMPSPTAWRCQEWGFTVPHQRGCCPSPRLLAQLNETRPPSASFGQNISKNWSSACSSRHSRAGLPRGERPWGLRGARARVMRPRGTACGLEEPGVGLEPQCQWYIRPGGVPALLPASQLS